MAIFELLADDLREAHTKERFADRVEFLLQQRGCTKSWLARELDVSRQALNHILKYNKKPKFVSEIAVIFNINPLWLKSGEGNITIESKPDTLRYLDVYSITELDQWDQLTTSPVMESIATHDHESQLLALCMNEQYAMVNKKFSAGCILIFDRQATATDKDFVLAKLQPEQTTVFRHYQANDQHIQLTSQDSQHENYQRPIKDIEIIGVLKETRIRF